MDIIKEIRIMKLYDTIDILDYKEISKKWFKEYYIEKNKPAIIKGLLEDTIAGKTWTLNRLLTEMGEYDINVFNVNDTKRTSYIRPTEQVKMKEMLHLIETNSSSDFRMFVNPILKKNKQVYAELPCPDFFKCNLQLPRLLFLGGRDCIVPLHFDFMKDDGLLTQFF